MRFQSGSNFTVYGNTSRIDTAKLTSLIKEQTVYYIREAYPYICDFKSFELMIISVLKVLGIATIVLSYLQVAFWLMASERQTKALRKELFTAILKQNIGWYDVYNSGELNNRLTE